MLLNDIFVSTDPIRVPGQFPLRSEKLLEMSIKLNHVN